MLCFGPRALWFLQGSSRVLAVLSHMPVRTPRRYPLQGQRWSCSVDTWVDRLLDIFAVWGKWILILGLFGFLKYCFPSAFLILIDKFCKKEKLCFLLNVSALSYWNLLSVFSRAGDDATLSGQGRTGLCAGSRAPWLCTEVLLPEQPPDRVSPRTTLKRQHCLSTLPSSSWFFDRTETTRKINKIKLQSFKP